MSIRRPLWNAGHVRFDAGFEPETSSLPWRVHYCSARQAIIIVQRPDIVDGMTNCATLDG